MQQYGKHDSWCNICVWFVITNASWDILYILLFMLKQISLKVSKPFNLNKVTNFFKKHV